MRWIVAVVLLAGTVSAQAQDAEREPPPVGGLFGLFGKSRPKPTPTERETVAPPVRATEKPTIAPTARPTATQQPTVAPEPTAPPPRALPSPTAARKPKKGAKVEPTPTPTPEEGAEGEAPEEERPEEEAPAEATPPAGTIEDRGAAPEIPGIPSAEPATREKPHERAAGGGGGGGSDVRLPSVEIQGELEKPDIFFVLPRARDESDEQLMRSRIKREITRPVIKDWIEEEMLLK